MTEFFPTVYPGYNFVAWPFHLHPRSCGVRSICSTCGGLAWLGLDHVINTHVNTHHATTQTLHTNAMHGHRSGPPATPGAILSFVKQKLLCGEQQTCGMQARESCSCIVTDRSGTRSFGGLLHACRHPQVRANAMRAFAAYVCYPYLYNSYMLCGRHLRPDRRVQQTSRA